MKLAIACSPCELNSEGFGTPFHRRILIFQTYATLISTWLTYLFVYICMCMYKDIIVVVIIIVILVISLIVYYYISSYYI